MHKQSLMVLLGALLAVTMAGASAHAQTATPAPKPTRSPEPVTAAQPAEAPAAEPATVEVRPGDSLSIIAADQQLESWRPLWNANLDLADPDLIYPGQKLVVVHGQTEDRPLPAGVVVPPVAATPSVGMVRRAAPANYAQGVGGILARVRLRESGGNYAINTGNGYYGAYQFDLGTWRGVGGSGLPSEASPAEQDMRAQMLYERRGCSPWPNTCY